MNKNNLISCCSSSILLILLLLVPYYCCQCCQITDDGCMTKILLDEISHLFLEEQQQQQQNENNQDDDDAGYDPIIWESISSCLTKISASDDDDDSINMLAASDAAWKGFVKLGSSSSSSAYLYSNNNNNNDNHNNNDNEWGKDGEYREYDPTPLKGQFASTAAAAAESATTTSFDGSIIDPLIYDVSGIIIAEPCNTASSIAFYRSMLAICDYDDDDDIDGSSSIGKQLQDEFDIRTVHALIRTFASLAYGSSLYHASQTRVGRIFDSKSIQILTYIIHQASIKKLIPHYDSILHDLSTSSRVISGIDMATELINIQLNYNNVHEWDDHISALNSPGYGLSIAATMNTLFNIILPSSTAREMTKFIGGYLLDDDDLDFILNVYEPKLVSTLREQNISPKLSTKTEMTFKLSGLMMKFVYALTWQELILNDDKIHDDIENEEGANRMPDINKQGNDLTGYDRTSTIYDSNTQNCVTVYPGDDICRRKHAHSKWHEMAANVFIDHILIAKDISNIIDEGKQSFSLKFPWNNRRRKERRRRNRRRRGLTVQRQEGQKQQQSRNTRCNTSSSSSLYEEGDEEEDCNNKDENEYDEYNDNNNDNDSREDGGEEEFRVWKQDHDEAEEIERNRFDMIREHLKSANVMECADALPIDDEVSSSDDDDSDDIASSLSNFTHCIWTSIMECTEHCMLDDDNNNNNENDSTRNNDKKTMDFSRRRSMERKLQCTMNCYLNDDHDDDNNDIGFSSSSSKQGSSSSSSYHDQDVLEDEKSVIIMGDIDHPWNQEQYDLFVTGFIEHVVDKEEEENEEDEGDSDSYSSGVIITSTTTTMTTVLSIIMVFVLSSSTSFLFFLQ